MLCSFLPGEVKGGQVGWGRRVERLAGLGLAGSSSSTKLHVADIYVDPSAVDLGFGTSILLGNVESTLQGTDVDDAVGGIKFKTVSLSYVDLDKRFSESYSCWFSSSGHMFFVPVPKYRCHTNTVDVALVRAWHLPRD